MSGRVGRSRLPAVMPPGSMPTVCAYCGEPAETRDHIPPRALFGSNPGELTTVPSCFLCNNEASKDDEWARMVLSFKYDVFEHPDVGDVLQKSLRSLRREEAAGMRAALLSTMEEVELYSEAGIYLGRTARYDVDLGRLERVFNRVLKGLWHLDKASTFPRGYDATTIFLNEIELPSPKMLRFITTVGQFLSGVEEVVIGRDVFRYRIRFLEDEPNSAVALMSLYNEIQMMGMITRAKSTETLQEA